MKISLVRSDKMRFTPLMSQTKYTLTVTRVLVGGFNTRSFTISFSEYEKAVASRDMYAADGCSTILEKVS